MKRNDRRTVIKRMGAAAGLLPLVAGGAARAQGEAADGGIGPDTVYELRTYHLNPGTEPKILDRFRTRETAIFKRCGMQPVAYWTAVDGAALLPGGGGTLIYILRHRSREAATASWAKFGADPEWVALQAETEKDGKFVVTLEHTFMKLTDFSPQV
ncbi:NIPSNAP family protein [Acidipila sp. EB88]|uniref:NIPSNAP family protein n=1 Tax=Acidipila sp. EB88 TaxID=2305226 RepID=UPI0013152E91|nr:NIPSNAP family protein [Acidipila sp. EB88]